MIPHKHTHTLYIHKHTVYTHTHTHTTHTTPLLTHKHLQHNTGGGRKAAKPQLDEESREEITEVSVVRAFRACDELAEYCATPSHPLTPLGLSLD